ncbi:hypothetical protein [Streptomyces qinglanensis]
MPPSAAATPASDAEPLAPLAGKAAPAVLLLAPAFMSTPWS